MDEKVKIVLGGLLHEFDHKWIQAEIAEEIADFASYHHSEIQNEAQQRNDLLLVAHADNLSAGRRKHQEEPFKPNQPLQSIFASLETNSKPESVFYKPIQLTKGLFYPQKDAKLDNSDYRRLLDGFKDALKKAPKTPDILLGLLEEYFSLIPYLTTESKGTDVSLFDHLKTTAAIALAAYNYLTETHAEEQFSRLTTDEIADDKTERYMCVGVDISGIQDFIYTITSKGALKLLRARSFYVEMLLEFLAMRLLKGLNLYRTNLLFLGGGNFIILAQHTEHSKKVVEQLIHEFNEHLFQEHQGRLWLCYDVVSFNGETFLTQNASKSRTIADVLEELHRKIQQKKLHKFDDIAEQIFVPQDIDGYYECEVCGTEISKDDGENDKKCPVCRNLYKVGGKIHKAKYVVYKPKGQTPEPIGEFNIYGNERLSLFDKPVEGDYVWVINPTKDELKDGVPLYMGNYPEMGRNFDPDMEDENAPTFNYFGPELVGTLRMDVDNLGYIFSRGLPVSKRTISRISALSRFFNLFFRRYINEIAKGNLGEQLQFSIICPRQNPRKNAPRELVIVYAGGDDLFIVGAWHDVIEMAFDIRECFRRFVGGNHITISGGLALNHVKHPIHLFARNAGEAEDDSKGISGKDAFTALGRTMKWQEWEEIIDMFLKRLREDFYSLVMVMPQGNWGCKIEPAYLPPKKDEKDKEIKDEKDKRDKKLPRGLIYKLMMVSDVFGEDKKGQKLEAFASFIYTLARNKLQERPPFDTLKNIVKSYNLLPRLKPLLMWLDLAIRKREENHV